LLASAANRIRETLERLQEGFSVLDPVQRVVEIWDKTLLAQPVTKTPLTE
jgi:hypothetical protein